MDGIGQIESVIAANDGSPVPRFNQYIGYGGDPAITTYAGWSKQLLDAYYSGSLAGTPRTSISVKDTFKNPPSFLDVVTVATDVFNERTKPKPPAK